MKPRKPTHRTAALEAYMIKRAAFEKLSWELPPAYLEDYFDQGVRTFFGVDLDDVGTLLADEQQPAFFAAYQADRISRN